MASTCYTSVDLCAVRVSKLTAGGAPLTGVNNGYVTDAVVSLGITITLKEGEELERINGCGDVCAVLNTPDKIKGIELSAEFCQLDAYLLEILTDVDVFTSGGNAIGFQFPAVGASPDPVCFEGWSKAWDVDRQAVPTFTSPDAAYVHWVFPFTRWVNGDMTLEHDLLVVPATAKGSENANITQDGPFNDWPSAVAQAGGVTRVGGWFFDDVLPTGDCDYVEVTSAAS